METPNPSINLGTCSWEYDSWRGLVYSNKRELNYLEEYSQNHNTVEVDQWFWPLFKGGKVVLPRPNIVSEYAQSVPKEFTFSIKVPNSITLTHQYNKDKKAQVRVNPYFLSNEMKDSLRL